MPSSGSRAEMHECESLPQVCGGGLGSVTNAGEGIPLLIVEVSPPICLRPLLSAALLEGSMPAAP